MRIAVIASAAMLIIAGAASLAPIRQTKAEGPRDFIFGGSDGYGIADCLTSGAACGRIVADAWCESQGFAKSASFRRAEPGEVTASTGSLATRDDGGAVIVTCTSE